VTVVLGERRQFEATCGLGENRGTCPLPMSSLHFITATAAEVVVFSSPLSPHRSSEHEAAGSSKLEVHELRGHTSSWPASPAIQSRWPGREP
jgi:hypothetical protein